MTQHTNAFPDLDRDLRFIPLGVEEPRVLTPGQIRRYNEAGHLFPIDIFSPTEMAEIWAYIDDLIPKALAAGWGNYDVVNWHKTCRGIWDIITEPRTIDVVADLLGDTVVLRHSHLFAKLAGDAKRVSWHQDASYWPLTPSRVVSAWPGDRRCGRRQLGDARDPRLAPPRPAHLPRQRRGREQLAAVGRWT